MATKTFKTRIKLKYDELSAWDSFSALQGEMLLGYKDGKIYAQVGTGDNGGKSPLWISGSNVDITGYPNNESTITTAQAAIADLNSRINTINTNGVVTSFGTKTGAITLNGASGLSMSDNELKIATATFEQFGVVKVKPGNGLTFVEGLIGLNTATSNENGAMSSGDYDKLLGIEAGAEVNDIVAVQVNGAALTPDGSRAVNITIAEGTENGKITVNGTGVAVHGLGSAAYTEASDYATDEQGAKADSALQEISAYGDGDFVTTTVSDKGEGMTQTVGVRVTTHNIATADANAENGNGLATAADVKSYVSSQLTGIVGAMVYRGTTTSYPPVASGAAKGDVYVASDAFDTYEKGDMFIFNGTTWDVVNGENQVDIPDANGTTITAGATNAVTVATVDGTGIPVKVQVTGGTATIATVTDGVVKLKAGVAQDGTSGTIIQGAGTDITLARVATTGDAADVVYNTEMSVTEAIAANIEAISTNATAINTLNDADTVEGSVAKSIKDAIEGLNAGTIQLATTGENVIQITNLKEENGIISSDGNTTIDVDGTVSDTNPLATKATVTSAVTNAALTIDGKKGTITTGNGLTDVSADNGSFGIKISESSANGLSVDENGIAMDVASDTDFGTVKVATANGLTNNNGTVSYAHNTTAITVASVNAENVVTINGTLTPDASDEITTSNYISLAPVAKTGDIIDLSQKDADYIIFDCGDAEGWD